MDWKLILLILPLMLFLWWAGFYATKRMRIEKNKQREERARYLLAKKAAREEAQTAADETKSKEKENI